LGSIAAGLLAALFARELGARAVQQGDEPERVVALRRNDEGGYDEEEPRAAPEPQPV